LGVRGFGHLRRPLYTDRKTKERKESAFYWLYWSHEGKRYSESTHATTMEAAEQFRRTKFMAIWGGQAPWEPRPEVTFGQIIERALVKARLRDRNIKTMERSVARLLGKPSKLDGKPSKKAKAEREKIAAVRFGGGEHMPANRGTEDKVDAYVTERKAQGYAAATINLDLAMLRRAYRVAFSTLDEFGHPLVRRVPKVELLELDNTRQQFCREAEYLAIRAHLTWCFPYLADFIRVTGWRHSEPFKVTWDRVDTEAGTILLPAKDTKSRKWRDPWPYAQHPILAAVVKHQRALKEKIERERGMIVTHMFTWEDGTPISNFRHQWNRARKLAGLPNKRIHDMRRTAARDALRATGDEQLAMRLIGAKTPSIFRRYRVVAQDDLAEAAKKLGAYHDEQRGAQPQLVIPFEKKATG
jgi:integrase